MPHESVSGLQGMCKHSYDKAHSNCFSETLATKVIIVQYVVRPIQSSLPCGKNDYGPMKPVIRCVTHLEFPCLCYVLCVPVSHLLNFLCSL